MRSSNDYLVLVVLAGYNTQHNSKRYRGTLPVRLFIRGDQARGIGACPRRRLRLKMQEVQNKAKQNRTRTKTTRYKSRTFQTGRPGCHDPPSPGGCWLPLVPLQAGHHGGRAVGGDPTLTGYVGLRSRKNGYVKSYRRCLGSGGAVSMALRAACSGILNKR